MIIVNKELHITENTEFLHELKHLKMMIQFMGHAHLSPIWSHKPFLTTVNFIYMITEGEAEIWCNGHYTKMTQGNMYFVPSNTPFAHHCSDSCKKIYCKVKLVSSVGEELPIVPPEGLELTGRSAFIKEAVRLYQKADYCSVLTLRAMIEGLVAEAMSCGEEQPFRRYSPVVADVLKIIHTEPHLALSAAVLAQRFSLSAGHLRNQFSKEVGLPLAQYVRKQVLITCAEDLIKRDLTLQEIAAKYGFCDQGHFSRLFLAHFGISPSKYRKEHII